tara:strand:- start:141 stop:359 length:219 start_codon:yes stop_codon:yes gene_type:complete
MLLVFNLNESKNNLIYLHDIIKLYWCNAAIHGYFSRLKNEIRNHNGLSKAKKKIIAAFFKAQGTIKRQKKSS